jgi:hypothetical protein
MAETTKEALLAYLREYGRQYHVRDLRSHLVAHGFDAARIDEAIAVYEAEGKLSENDAPRSAFFTFSKISGVCALVTVLNFLVLGPPFLKSNATLEKDLTRVFTVLCCEFAAGLVLVLVGWIAKRRDPQSLGATGLRLGPGLFFGAAVSGGLGLFIALVILGGVCLKIMKGM